MFNWLNPQPGTGALLDPRSAEEKSKDYLFKEIVSAADPVDWEEKDFSNIRKFSVRNQKGSSSCVAQTMAKLTEVMLWLKEGSLVPFSATPIYQRRANAPGAGMWGQNAFELARQGMTLEILVPSQMMSEPQMNAYKIDPYEDEVGKVFKYANYVTLPIKDLDTVASIIQKTGKAVAVGFYFTSAEWSLEVPVIKTPALNSSTALRHWVAAVDFGIYKGKEGLFIEDSAHFGNKNRRFITRDFFEKRNTAAMYPIAFKFEDGTADKPSYIFTRTLNFGEQSADIVALQSALQYFGHFPNNVETTGFFGSVTAKAVYDWQVEYAVASIEELNNLRGRTFGPKSISKMNALLS